MMYDVLWRRDCRRTKEIDTTKPVMSMYGILRYTCMHVGKPSWNIREDSCMHTYTVYMHHAWCIYIHVYIDTHNYMCVCVCVCICICMDLHVHINIQYAHIHYIYTHTQMAHTYTLMHKHLHTLYKLVYLHTICIHYVCT